MEKITSYVQGCTLGCAVVHSVRVQTRYNFDPYRLEAEIERRVRNTDRSKAAAVHIKRGDGANVYRIEFAHLDALDMIRDVIAEIERDVEHAESIQALLDLVEAD